MFTTLYINFSDTQGQITLKLVVVSGRNFNSSELSCMCVLPARMRMFRLNLKELDCSQDFSHYKSMGIFPEAQGQLTPQSLVESGPNSNLSEILWLLVVLITCEYEEDPIKNEGASVFTTFPNYNPMGAIRCHGNQSSNPIWSKT